MLTRRLSRREVPDGSVIGVLSDIHIPGHDEEAMKLVVECCERVGATHVILNGDIADCGPSSRHEGKRKRAILDEGCLKESVAAGYWIYEWARTRPCWYVLGNHEAWVANYIKESPELRGTATTELMGLPADGDGWEVLPQFSRIRLGSLNWEHGDGFFKSGDGGQNPATKIKSRAPDQTTHVGHLHRMFSLYWSTPDENGVHRTRAARGNGHLSQPEYHEEYAGTYVNWQQGFELTRVHYVDDKPRFTTSQVEIHRDGRGRAFFEHEGRLYR
jgi:predicted phosphodiesterase